MCEDSPTRRGVLPWGRGGRIGGDPPACPAPPDDGHSDGDGCWWRPARRVAGVGDARAGGRPPPVGLCCAAAIGSPLGDSARPEAEYHWPPGWLGLGLR